MENEKYVQAVEYINSIRKFTKKNTLEHTQFFLKELNIESLNCPIIHVAGTNGKGSVCNYLKNLLMENGKKVGMFTSPHLIDIRERIKINDENISCEDFVLSYERVLKIWKEHNDYYHPTYFEFLFLMAMEYYTRKCPDYIILETGLGGRLDATNAISNPALTIITEIGLDHCQYLGDTKEKIAFEKAGIIKMGVPLIFSNRDKNATKVIQNVAKSKQAETFNVDANQIKFENNNDKSIDFWYNSLYYNNVKVCICTTAVYQVENATLALRAYEVLMGKPVLSKQQMCLAIKNASWPGRMEEVMEGVFIDGAHNEDGIDAFIRSVNGFKRDIRKILIFSVVDDKEYHKMIERLVKADLFSEFILTGLKDKRGLAVSELEKEFSKAYSGKFYTCDTTGQALKLSLQDKGKEDIVFICGSLYLAGELEALLKEN